jgi:hypothetical protein
MANQLSEALRDLDLEIQAALKVEGKPDHFKVEELEREKSQLLQDAGFDYPNTSA